MGGGVKSGNVTPAAEFNMHEDPEAGEIVFQSGVPIVMAGLDVTWQCGLTVGRSRSSVKWEERCQILRRHGRVRL